jgi:hypothetical protein
VARRERTIAIWRNRSSGGEQGAGGWKRAIAGVFMHTGRRYKTQQCFVTKKDKIEKLRKKE